MPNRNAIWEAVYPYVIGLASGLAVSRLDISTPEKIASAGYNVPAMYTSAQTLGFFATGILFSMFVFTMAPAAGFIAKLQKLRLFNVFRRYTIETMMAGMLSCAACTPLASINVGKMSTGYFPLLAVLSVSTMACFIIGIFRVLRVFFFWASQTK